MSAFGGSRILITGVGRAGQMGEALALAFAQRDAMPVLVGHALDDVEARARALREGGYEAASYACDLSDQTQVAALARSITADHGAALAGLVNAAGGFAMSGPVAASDPDVTHRMLTINFITAYLATRAFLPALRAGRGAVVYFASEAALPGAATAEISAYAASKSAVLALMRAVAAEEAENGVRANAVAPGAIRTAANVNAMGDAPALTREAVADAVVYLCTDEARAVTGQVIRLRGNMLGGVNDVVSG